MILKILPGIVVCIWTRVVFWNFMPVKGYAPFLKPSVLRNFQSAILSKQKEKKIIKMC